MSNPDNPFEFLMVIFSVIIGLTMTEILAGSARLLRARSKATPYWIHTVTIVGIFLASMSLWWEAWGLRYTEDWTYPGLLHMLAGPVGLYMVASLVFPDTIEGCNFRDYYYQNRTLVWSIIVLIIIVATSFRPVAFGHSIVDIDNVPSLIQILIAITLAWSKNKYAHGILAPIFFLLIAVDQLVFRYLLSQS